MHTMASIGVPQDNIQVSVMTDVADVSGALEVTCKCFGEQVPDAILEALNPSWSTPDGRERALQRWTKRFNAPRNYTAAGDPTKTLLKAVANDSNGNQKIVGYAVWIQLSAVEGFGERPMLNPREEMNLEDLYPGDPSEQEYLAVLMENLNRQKNELVEKQRSASPPAIMALDLCVVHPEFQRRGIATKLVQWGLDEAKRRGGLVCCMEASTMGRPVYGKLGFKQEGLEIDYKVNDAKFAKIGMPSNIFMRTDGDVQVK